MGETNITDQSGHKVLEGSKEDVEFWRTVLVGHFRAQPSKGDVNGSRMKTETYNVPIMGNPSSPQSVKLRVEIDGRDGAERGKIKIEHGCELLLWQARTQTLCNCCLHNPARGKPVPRVCTELRGPSDWKRSCNRYRYAGT
jgi:hypothetical protein